MKNAAFWTDFRAYYRIIFEIQDFIIVFIVHSRFFQLLLCEIIKQSTSFFFLA